LLKVKLNIAQYYIGYTDEDEYDSDAFGEELGSDHGVGEQALPAHGIRARAPQHARSSGVLKAAAVRGF